MKNNEKRFNTTIALVIVALLVSGAVYLYKQINQTSTDKTGTNAPNADSEMANWKTYTNSKFNYLIKYPSDFTLVFEPQYAETPQDKSPSFNLVNFTLDWNTFKGLDPGQAMIKAEVNDASMCVGSIEDVNKKEVDVGGIKAIKYIQNEGDGGESVASYSYFLQNNGNCFLIKLFPYPSDVNIVQKFDQIVSTLRFN